MPKKSTSNKNNGTAKTTPIKKAVDVTKSRDEKIDQDFPGFPHPPSTPEAIKNAGKNKKTNAG